MHNESKARLLVCSTPETLAAAHETLHDHYDCIFSLTLNDACSHLHLLPDAILCNVAFEQGRLFDLLRYMKAHPYACRVPLVVVRPVESPAHGLMKATEAAIKLVGVDTYIETFRWRLEYGSEMAAAKVRDALNQLIAEARKSQHAEILRQRISTRRQINL